MKKNKRTALVIAGVMVLGGLMLYLSSKKGSYRDVYIDPDQPWLGTERIYT